MTTGSGARLRVICDDARHKKPAPVTIATYCILPADKPDGEPRVYWDEDAAVGGGRRRGGNRLREDRDDDYMGHDRAGTWPRPHAPKRFARDHESGVDCLACPACGRRLQIRSQKVDEMVLLCIADGVATVRLSVLEATVK